MATNQEENGQTATPSFSSPNGTNHTQQLHFERVTSEKLSKDVLTEIHSFHLGIVRMKSIA